MTSQEYNVKAEPGLLGRIRSSILSDPVIPVTEAERKRYLIRNLVLHFRPALVPERTLRFSLTFGLGGMAAVLVLLQIGTGVLLKFVYEPTQVAAYASVQSIIHDVPFGRLMRNLHHWGGNLLVLTAVLHMLRVFFTGAFHRPRQFNWVIGLTMFGAILAANFTGYLLPWDQLAYWAVTVSTGMLDYIPLVGVWLKKMILGGADIGPSTLRIFFAAHTAVVPAGLLFLMGFHFWRIRKAGGLVIPRAPEEAQVKRPERVAALPNLILREVVAASVLFAVIIIWSVFVNAPLADPANPGLSPDPTKAPWYFAGFQELLMHLDPVLAACFLPLFFGTALIAVPYLKYPDDTGGVWFASQTGRKTGVIAAVIALVATPVLILIDERLIASRQGGLDLPSMAGNVFLPVGLLLAGHVGFVLVLRKRYSTSKNETVQAVFTLLMTAFAVLTMIGVWFRGEKMALSVPW